MAGPFSAQIQRVLRNLGASRLLTLSGVLYSTGTQAATIANTTETTLATYTMPADTLAASGRSVRVTAWGTFANTVSTKTVKAYFGSSSVSLAGVLTNQAWRCERIITRTGAATQSGITQTLTAVAPALSTTVATTEDLTAAIIIKVTGTNGSANADDIVLNGMTVELI